MDKKSKFSPFFGSSLILIVCQTFTFYVAVRHKEFLEANQISPPQISLQLALVYFLGVVVLVGVILFLVPTSKLVIILKIMFAFLFSWGVFIALGLSLPIFVASLVSIAGGLLWLLRPRVWLHNLLMVFAVVSAGSVFGFLFSPWTFIIFMLVISIYDVLAVRFGYMMWLAKRLSESQTLPAFIIPERISSWNLNLKEANFQRLMEDKPTERGFSILGGGDIGFPLLLIVSVFSTYGFTSSLIVAAFSLVGLISAYWIQLFFLKGKPMPALPPICFVSFLGFLIVYLL